MIREHYLKDRLIQLKKYKHLADRALSQVSDEQFFEVIVAAFRVLFAPSQGRPPDPTVPRPYPPSFPAILR